MVFVLLACNRERNHPGYYYMNDMAPSIAYEYYSENPNFPNGATAQNAVKGTIPRGKIPYPYPKTTEGQKQAGLELVNPLKDTTGMSVGKAKYELTCIMCHGPLGDGKGYLVTTKKFNKEVTSLIGDFVKNKPDGEIYHVISVGSVSGFMGSQSLQISPEDRWKVVMYVRSLAKKNNN